MIIITVPDITPQIEIGQAAAQEIQIKTIPEAPLDDFCLCDLGLQVCEYEELAFHSGSNRLENDYTSLFINKVDSTDVIKVFLINLDDSEETELTELNADKYGFYSEDDIHKGFIIEFDVLNSSFPLLRNIRFRIEQNVFGSDVMRETHKFKLEKFNAVVADGTIRIESINSGRIESGNDYDALNWKKSIRISGFFGNVSPQ